MKETIHYGILIALLFMVACERPQSPDFNLEHKLQAPLTIDRTYTFLGEKNALIDTTSEAYDSLFIVDNDGLIRLSKEERFDVVDLNDALPNIKIEPTSVTLTVEDQTDSQHKEGFTLQDTGSSEVDDSEFRFHSPNHFIELINGQLDIKVDNQFDVNIENLKVTFPEIKTGGKNLTVEMKGIPSRAKGGQEVKSVDLSGFKIHAPCNCLNYTVKAVTQNRAKRTSFGSTSTQEETLTAEITTSNLSVKQAQGDIQPINLLLNKDVDADGHIDLFSVEEAEVTAIDGMGSLSEQISDITFTSPVLNMIYQTNLGVKTTIYASIAGINRNGEAVYLKSTDKNNKFFVPSSEIPEALRANGQMLKEGQVIKFDLKTPSDGFDMIPFDSEHTNISRFFSSLPSRIHFAGVAHLEGVGRISHPVQFEPYMGVDIPVNFSADRAFFKENVESDLSDLPGDNGNRQLNEGVLTIGYVNKLPLDMELKLQFLDEQNNEVMVIGEDDPLIVKGAPVHPETRFSKSGVQKNSLQISLSEGQLKKINNTRSMNLDIIFDTPKKQEVKIRAEDSVSFDIQMSVDITSRVD